MLAFFFSDIENSTWLWEHYTEQMWDVISRHDAILKDCVNETGGQIVKHTGDGVFVVFGATDRPLDCAVEIQRRLDREDWSSIEGLRVRIGIHAGAAEKHANDYFGPDVNKAAKVLAVTKGGQILVTPAVIKAYEIPDGTVIQDLGVRLLKGIDQRQRVYRLIRQDLAEYVYEGSHVDSHSPSPKASPNQCPVCSTVNIPNTLFCEQCGRGLHQSVESHNAQPGRTADAVSTLALQIEPNGPILRLPADGTALLGRGGSPVSDVEFIDLATAGGLDAGVSREHAALDIHRDRITIKDLNSTNGTYVNRRQIAPNTPVPVSAGDTIHMGRLKARVVEAGG